MNSNVKATRTEIVKASQIDRVLQEIWQLQNPDGAQKRADEQKAYTRRLKQYARARGNRPEIREDRGIGYRPRIGVNKTVAGQEVFVERPEPKYNATHPTAYYYSSYQREKGLTQHAANAGFLANNKYNRNIRFSLVTEYAEQMANGEWRDLLSDPIAVTSDGQVLNGQHRLAALDYIARNARKSDDKYDEGLKVKAFGSDYDPKFLIIWGVNPEEALITDLTSRTANDQATVAKKLIKTQGLPPQGGDPAA